MSIPRLAISTGEPAGIGPDIMLLAAQQNYNADLLVIGDPALFTQRAKALSLPINITLSNFDQAKTPTLSGNLKVIPTNLENQCEPGKLNRRNANYVFDVLDLAINACIDKTVDAMVTGPIHKSVLHSDTLAFSGHTEYLAEKTQASTPVMMLATEGLRVALLTTHIPLKDVASRVTKKRIFETIKILHHDLQKQFNISQPRIIVAGLNPHAGEDGCIGSEDAEIIKPVLDEFRSQGMNVIGPLSADTLFTSKYLDNTDAVLAMYHDQGLPVLKYKGFGQAINVTLGLPIIRTSVDHGTALDLAGTKEANPKSMILAINTALDIVKSSQRI